MNEMSNGATWEFELTSEQIPLLQQQIEWALQRQNQRWAAAMPANRMSRAVLIIATIGSTSLTSLYFEDRAHRQPLLFFGGAAFFAAAVVLGLVLPTTRAWSKRVAGRMLARHVARSMAPLARRAPYSVRYILDGETLHTTIDKLRIRRKTHLRSIRLALHTANVVLLFRRRHSLNPFRLVYLPTADEWQLLGALHGISEEVTGAVKDYVVPEARLVD